MRDVGGRRPLCYALHRSGIYFAPLILSYFSCIEFFISLIVRRKGDRKRKSKDICFLVFHVCNKHVRALCEMSF